MALDGAGESARRRRVYEPTEVGRTAHVTWLRTPIEASTVGRDLGLHLVRFVMMEHAFSRDEVLGFLDNLSTLSRRLPLSLSDTRRSPRLAIATRALPYHGLAVHRASLEWAGHAIAALRAAPIASS